jgi:putative sporulation protein YtaF
LILFILGIIKFFDGCIKTLITKHKLDKRQVTFKLHDIRFILQVYADNTQADIDHSKELSPVEAASLAIALSFDGLAVGFGAGLSNINPLEVIILSIVLGAIAVLTGSFIGNRLSEKINLDLSWASGVLLILLAFMKL